MDTRTRAHRALVSAAVAVGVAAGAFVLWRLRIVLALLFVAIVLGSAMRPSVEWLARRGVPRGLGVLAHYAVLASLVAVGLEVAVPQLLHQATLRSPTRPPPRRPPASAT